MSTTAGAVQIQVPPELPEILKQYTKAAIKSQPPDVLSWSAVYFRALVNGDELPVRDAASNQLNHLTPGFLRILNRQLGPRILVPVATIANKWSNLALPRDQFDRIVEIGKFEGNIYWIKFFAIASSSLSENLYETLKMCCELLAPEGDSHIPMELFMEIYQFLATVDGTIKQQNVREVRGYLQPISAKQNGYVCPKNFIMNEDCPSLQ
jgi:hypothetical protein